MFSVEGLYRQFIDDVVVDDWCDIESERLDLEMRYGFPIKIDDRQIVINGDIRVIPSINSNDSILSYIKRNGGLAKIVDVNAEIFKLDEQWGNDKDPVPYLFPSEKAA